MKLRIEVTHEDIANGWRGYQYLCPIARAAARALGLALGSVRVEASRIELPGGGRAVLPIEASAFVCDFDRELAVVPFAFEIEG